eukprot:1365989-Amorphochlora_amoeboformis.AAC.1
MRTGGREIGKDDVESKKKDGKEKEKGRERERRNRVEDKIYFKRNEPPYACLHSSKSLSFSPRAFA